MNPKRWSILFAALVGLFWFIFVWPTAWQYFKQHDQNFRVNRFTSETQSLTPYGWRTSVQSPPLTDAEVGLGRDKSNPFADLPNAKPDPLGIESTNRPR